MREPKYLFASWANGGLSLVEADAEGFEAQVLEAVELTLARNNPSVLSGFLPICQSVERQASSNMIMRCLLRLKQSLLGTDKGPFLRFVGFTRMDRAGGKTALVEEGFHLSNASMVRARGQCLGRKCY